MELILTRNVIYNDKGQPFSSWKPAEKFAWQWENDVVGWPYVAEHFFHPKRAWRFDFAWPEPKVAVEVSGFGFGHQSIAGVSGDYEKLNEAVAMGWRVLQFSSKHLGSKAGVEQAVELVCRVLTGV